MLWFSPTNVEPSGPVSASSGQRARRQRPSTARSHPLVALGPEPDADLLVAPLGSHRHGRAVEHAGHRMGLGGAGADPVLAGNQDDPLSCSWHEWVVGRAPSCPARWPPARRPRGRWPAANVRTPGASSRCPASERPRGRGRPTAPPTGVEVGRTCTRPRRGTTTVAQSSYAPRARYLNTRESPSTGSGRRRIFVSWAKASSCGLAAGDDERVASGCRKAPGAPEPPQRPSPTGPAATPCRTGRREWPTR